jgi:hypothetical protein
MKAPPSAGLFRFRPSRCEGPQRKAHNQPKGHTVSEIDKNSEEFKAAVAEAIDEAVSGLKAKNNELIAKNKKLQQGATIDPADLEAVERERDEWKAKAQAAEKAAKKAETDRDAAVKARSDIDSAYSNTLRDAALAEALAKAGVTNPVHQKAAKALLKDAVQVVDENGSRVVKAGDKALADHITEWAGSDEGKHFVTAPDTQGSGSHGGRGTPQETKGNAAGTRPEAVARAEQLLKQFEE